MTNNQLSNCKLLYWQELPPRCTIAATSAAVLKSENDLNEVIDYRCTPTIAGLKKSKRNTAITSAKRMFLRAYTRSLWGLDASTMSYAELAQWLTTQGYSTKKSDVEILGL